MLFATNFYHFIEVSSIPEMYKFKDIQFSAISYMLKTNQLLLTSPDLHTDI